MTATVITVACAECGRAFEAKSPRAKFCPGGRCRKAASRRANRRDQAVEPPYSLTTALEELDAMLELIPVDIEALESLGDPEDDPVLYELLAGQEVNWRSLEQLRAWLVTFAAEAGPLC